LMSDVTGLRRGGDTSPVHPTTSVQPFPAPLILETLSEANLNTASRGWFDGGLDTRQLVMESAVALAEAEGSPRTRDSSEIRLNASHSSWRGRPKAPDGNSRRSGPVLH
jgi:hypothetical protein